ncbi:MAG: PAS domain S-box protein, partial [Gemmatimonadales bacterium]
MHGADPTAYLHHLEKALQTMQLGVTITDVDGTIVYVNPADAHLHGYAVDELLGQDVGIFSPPSRRAPLHLDQLRELTSWKRESVNVRKDGSTFPVQLLSDVVRGPDDEPIGVVTTCEDITERRAAE